MRVLLMTSAEKGHLNPMVGVAQWLRALGHHVGWLTLPEPADALRALDVEVLGLPPQPGAPHLETGGEALARLVLDPPALRAWIRGLLLDPVPGLVEPVRAAVRAFSPDVMALDGMLYPGVIAAHLEGVPWVGVSSALTLLEPPGFDSELLRTVRALAADRQALFARYGLSPSFRTCECLSPRANVIFATTALVGADAPLPPATELVGPSRPRGARGDETPLPALPADRPLVYASFGSQIWWQPALFRRLAEAAAPLGVRLVLSAGALATPEFARRLPGQVTALPYAPQLQVLRRAAAFVSHGGANSVMEAMDHGVPLLLLPVCNDQPLQAHYVARAGVGVALDQATATVEELRAALRHVLHDAALRTRVAEVQASYAGHDGARRAAEAVLSLAS